MQECVFAELPLEPFLGLVIASGQPTDFALTPVGEADDRRKDLETHLSWPVDQVTLLWSAE
jgi:hypothetical protein